MLTVSRITTTACPAFARVDVLYETAFPYHEKREPQAKQHALNNPCYALQSWSDGDRFVGMIGAWDFGDYAYIEHLAVDPQLRSQGYGKLMLQQFLGDYPLTVLEIDPLTTEIAHKRLRFYQSLGFRQNDYAHHHPSYHAGVEDHALIVLSYPDALDEVQYLRFAADLRNVVMAR